MATLTEEFNASELKAEILQALESPDESAPFACYGKVANAVNPGLDIKGLGLIGLPISSREIETIIGKCRKSPFGKGEKTVVDDSVRKSWELDPSEFQITNPLWPACMDDLIFIVHAQLGLTCARANIRAELYKMLIYEPGAFFKPHQDSEKTPGMFGTLVVCLPSQHQGGRVVLSHNKEKVNYDSADYTPLDTSYGAWYSDVFHEVEEVTLGHRVVLTFNLVQKQSSLKQKAPDADSKARLKRALEAWDYASMANARNFPPYLVHPLDHEYSEEYFDLDMLKGDDGTQVCLLYEACQETGWDVYLATHEKILTGDDDWGMRDFDRDDEYKRLIRIDGSETDLKPDYDRECYLEDYESSDEEADESEHEGYTGNEGAPATFWYRKFVALLVPPSRSFEFGLTPENKNAIVLEKLRTWTPQAHDPETRKKLYTLCNVILQLDQKSGVWPRHRAYHNSWSSYENKLHGKSSSRNETTSCEREIAKIALEQDWLDVFDQVPVTHKVDPEVLKALGYYLRRLGISNLAKSMNNMLHGVASISSKHAAVQRITEAFHSADGPAISQQLEKDFEEWHSSAIKDILTTKERASAADGTALAQIAKSSATDITASVLIALNSANTKTVAAFIVEFAKDNPELESQSQRRCLEATLDKLWADFSYIQPSSKPQTQSPPQPYPYSFSGLSTHREPSRVEHIDVRSLGPLLTITKHHCGGSDTGNEDSKGTTTAPSALRIMSDAICDTSEAFLRDELLTFILDAVSHKFPALIIDGDNTEADSDLFDALSHFIINTITTIIRHQGPEPLKPKTWQLPVNSCGCAHCDVIGDFMKNPTRKEIAYPTAERNRKHLDSQYGWAGSGDYNISVDRNSGTPFKWVCRKEHKSWSKAHKAWKQKHDQLQDKLRAIDMAGAKAAKKTKPGAKNGKQSDGVLKNWLGEHYEVLMEARIEKLPVHDGPGGALELNSLALTELGQSGVNERQNHKRALEDEAGGLENVKRPRLDLGESEVIDLT